MKLTIYNSNAIITLIDKIIKLEKTYLKTPVTCFHRGFAYLCNCSMISNISNIRSIIMAIIFSIIRKNI